MRLLLSTYGSRGDVEPLVALAMALRAAGVDSVLSAPADREFVQLAGRAGVELAPAFMPVRDWIALARRFPSDIPSYGQRMIAAQYRAIDAAAAGCDAILATGLAPSVGAARCVADQRGLPFVHTSFCPMYLPSAHHPPLGYPGHPHPVGVTGPAALWAHNAEVMNALFGGPINQLRTAVGLPEVADIRQHLFTERPLLASDPALWPWTATELCAPEQTGAWILPDPRPLPCELEAFLAAGSPPVYFGFGSIAAPDPAELARTAIAAIRAQGRRPVLAQGWAGLMLPDQQTDCFLVGEVNQQALFRRVAAVIHHGGAGTTTTAARAGAPQVVVPQGADQPFWAQRLHRLSAGVRHDGAQPTTESLAAALAAALQPQTASRARALATRMNSDGAARAAELLIARVGEHQAAPPAQARKAESDIHALARRVQAIVDLELARILPVRQDEFQRRFEAHGDLAYGTLNAELFRPVQTALREAGFKATPRLPGSFQRSREWGNPEETHQQRWMWSVIRTAQGTPIGSLAVGSHHDHSRFRLPRSPEILALRATVPSRIVAEIAQTHPRYAEQEDFKDWYAQYLAQQSSP
jgi:vancomycin aglycone glucosyltransferase